MRVYYSQPHPIAPRVENVAVLKGRTLQDRVKALIAIAHPEDRDKLMHDAKELMFI